MVARHPTLDRLLGALRARRLASARELGNALGASQPSISRWLAAAGDQVVRIGQARSSRYAAVRNVRGLGERWPLYRIDGNRVTQLTNLNGRLLAQLDPVTYDKFSFTGANNDTVWGWTLKPANASAKVPISFLVHGGPQGSFNDSWSYRWNPRLFSAPGYAAVSVDFHGSTGYGQAFADAIHQNWGGWPLVDLQKGLAYATAHDPHTGRVTSYQRSRARSAHMTRTTGCTPPAPRTSGKTATRVPSGNARVVPPGPRAMTSPQIS